VRDVVRKRFHRLGGPRATIITPVVEAIAELERGRDSYAKRKWVDAYQSLAAADQRTPLSAEDLELLARSAYMLGRDDDYVSGLERAHHAYLESGEPLRAVRCGWWIGHNLVFRGEMAPARGWFARAQRLLERERRDCVERGYVLMAALLEDVFGGDHEAAHARSPRSPRSASASAMRTWSQSG
jgi:hypothetical protein